MGSSLIKFVFVEGGRSELVLRGAGLFYALAEEGAGLLNWSEESIARIRTQIERAGLVGMPAAANIEDPSMRIRRIDLPKIPPEELVAAVRWQLRDHVDGNIDSYVVRATPLFEKEDQLSVIGYAVRREAVVRQCELIRRFGFKPITIEPSAVSLLRLCDATYGFYMDPRYALVDFGSKVSVFTVMESGRLLFSRPLSGICEEALLRLISRNLEVSESEASQRLWQYRKQARPVLDDRLQVTVQHYFSQILLEIERSIDAFCLMFQTDSLGPLHVTGGASCLPGLFEYLSRELGAPPRSLNSFECIVMSQSERLRFEPLTHLFGVAAGLSFLGMSSPSSPKIVGEFNADGGKG